MNDLMAGGVYDRMEERGKLPGKEVSVTGYDNRELSGYYKPPLTTISLPLHDIGYTASEVIMRMVEEKELKEPDGIYRVGCHMLERSSVRNNENQKKISTYRRKKCL